MTKEQTETKREVRRLQTERRQDSMTLILDHAEAEFAAKGYNGVTISSVAASAGVDTSLMRYYFGDKEKLFAAVFRRRAPEANAKRLAALDAYRPSLGNGGTLEGLLDAFMRPAFEMADIDDKHRNYASIVAYVNSSRGKMYELMSETFDPVSWVLVDDMKILLPHASKEKLYWSYHFLTGSFTFSLGRTGRIDRLSAGLVHSDNFLGIADRLPVFVAAGIRALCAPDGPPDLKPPSDEDRSPS